MAWTAPKTWIAGELATAVLGNLHWRDNLNALRTGGLGFAQAQHFIFASSATQFSHIDAQTGKIPRYNGATQTWEMMLPAEASWPIGIIYRTVVATNPATLLGFGTWTLLSPGSCTVAIDSGQAEFDTAGETGGSKTVTVTIPELPSHTHLQTAHNHTQNPHDHTVSGMGNTIDVQLNPGIDWTAVDNTGSKTTGNTTATNDAVTATNQNEGGGGAHQNMMPSIACYIWYRSA